MGKWSVFLALSGFLFAQDPRVPEPVRKAPPVIIGSTVIDGVTGVHAPNVSTVTPQQFGAKCDGSTDDRAALQASLDALAGTGGAVFIPKGECLSSGSLNVTGRITILGEGKPAYDGSVHGSFVHFQSGGFVQSSLVWDVVYRNLGVLVDQSAGPAFTLNHGGWLVSGVSVKMRNPAQPAFSAPEGSIENTIEDFVINAAANYSVPLIRMVGGGGTLNNTTIRKGQLIGATGSSAPMIYLEGLSGDTNILIENMVFETPISGAIALYSINNSSIANIWLGDLSTTPTAPGVLIAKSPQLNSVPSSQILIQNMVYYGGTAQFPSVRCDCNVSGQGQVTIQNSRIAFVDNAGPHANPFYVLGPPSSATFLGDPAMTPVLGLSTPATSRDPCTPGAIWADANYVYVCIAYDSIKRAALTAF
jgi:hypothetical protein